MSEQKETGIAQESSENKDKSVWSTALNTAVETIAKDNKLIGTALKVILSPLALIAILCGFGYLIWKNYEYRKQIAALEKELSQSRYEVKDLKKDIVALEKIRMPKQITAAFEEVQDAMHGIEYLPSRQFSQTYKQPAKKKYIHLD